MSNLVIKAEQFAINAHESIKQIRKYTKEPYYIHPQAVAQLVKNVGGDDEQIAAAFLHDVVEDTGTTLETIKEEFGEGVAELVEMLTDVSKSSDGNRAIRKAIDRAHTAKASPRAKTVKLADLIDNTKSIVQYDPGFAWVYLKEKSLMLDVLKEGNPVLLDFANNLMNFGLLKLKSDYKQKELKEHSEHLQKVVFELLAGISS